MASTSNERLKAWWKRTKANLRHTYRLIVMNNETFEEVGSYRLTLLNVYVAASTIFVLLTLLVVLAIAFTPLRRYVPGYGQGDDSRRQVERMYREVQSLEKQLAAHRDYAANIQRVLVGDVETAADLEKTEVNLPVDSFEEIPVSQEEVQLREELELQAVGALARRGRSSTFPSGETPIEQLFFTPPINGDISAAFMLDKKHYGVDVVSPKNTPIKAAMDGFIFFSDWTLETGNTIGIQHANNIITFYKHNSALLKKTGSFVRAGEAVAIIGNTGTLSDGPHLHFEIWHKGKPVDPAEYVAF